MEGINPWFSMWIHPRKTIRTILQVNPKYGVFYLAAIYSLSSFFYYSNYWSIGISVPFYYILVLGVILCPFIGFIWLYFTGWILYFTGKWLEGNAQMLELRAVVAWSKIPIAINLLIWFILMGVHPRYVFILDAGGPSSLLINFIMIILGIWSYVLLIQSIREVQSFSVARSIINVILALFFSTLFIFILFSFFRYLYILSVA